MNDVLAVALIFLGTAVSLLAYEVGLWLFAEHQLKKQERRKK